MNGERCNFVTCEKNGWHCGSYAFNLERDGIEQGGFCDVHYWQSRAEAAENVLALAQPVQPAEPKSKLLLEHSGCGHSTQVEQITARLNPGDKVMLVMGKYSAELDANRYKK